VLKLAHMSSGYAGRRCMQSFLECWREELEKKIRATPMGSNLESKIGNLRSQVATEDDLARIEDRIDAKLPPSYRDFLLLGGGGLRLAGTLVVGELDYGFYLADDVRAFDQVDSAAVAIWTNAGDVGDEAYYVYDATQDSIHIRASALSTALAVGDDFGGGYYLLNPKEILMDGEWEAWYLSPHLPGAYRYMSFADLLARTFVIDILDEDASPVMTREGFRGTCAEHLFNS